MIIAVERSTAQDLHANTQQQVKSLTNDDLTWSVRTTGEFVIIMNNRFALPVIVRHPKRFNDSRAFVAAFKREFLNLLETSSVPHAKIRLIRDRQFKKVQFTTSIAPNTATYLQEYQDLLTGPNAIIDWENEPTNTDLALQLAEGTLLNDDQGNSLSIMTRFEQYTMEDYHLPAHPSFNEHNRGYLYRSSSLNDVMNAVAVNQRFISDYRQHLEHQGKSDQIIDRDTDVAADYCSYCEANGISTLDDLTMPYYYLLHYQDNSDEDVSDTRLRGIATALREFARFMRLQKLFSDEDYEQFFQAVAQSWADLHSKQRYYHFRQIIRGLQFQLNNQRRNIIASRYFAKRRMKLRVSLVDYFPEIWREFEVGGDTRLDKLCLQVLASFNAQGNHLFDLRDDNNVYQLPLMDSGLKQVADLTDHWLGEYQVGDSLTLDYDFGDSWQFKIQIVGERDQPRLQNDGYPILLAGFGSGIIEDIGGTAGLQQAAKDDPMINHQINIKDYQNQWGKAVDQLQRHYSIRWFSSQVWT